MTAEVEQSILNWLKDRQQDVVIDLRLKLRKPTEMFHQGSYQAHMKKTVTVGHSYDYLQLAGNQHGALHSDLQQALAFIKLYPEIVQAPAPERPSDRVLFRWIADEERADQ